MQLPKIGTPLTSEHLDFLQTFIKACRRDILEMTLKAQSGHPGGSLSSLDYLAILYTFIVSQTGERVVVSNGHISPAVYSVLAEMGILPKHEVIDAFRKIGSIYEGHVTRHVRGVEYGTGPLGIGVSVAAGFAFSEKLKKTGRKTYALMGDGEAQEGQVYEMMHFSQKYVLNDFIVFIDYNKVQLSASFDEIMPLDLVASFRAGGFEVFEFDAHDLKAIWEVLGKAYSVENKAVALIGHSIMGKGVDFMETEGVAHRATWHGSPPSIAEAEPTLKSLALSAEEEKQLEDFRTHIQWKPKKAHFEASLSPVSIEVGEAIVYTADMVMDCRTAYGKTLFDLAKRNPQILALTADLRASVMTKFVHEQIPHQHIECGVCEQNMVSVSGGLSLSGFIPFCSTFGAFMTSRAKDQARVNDINRTNVKMVATHCGLSVGEDGPTHQAIDDMGSMLGLFNTMVIEPADANHTDRIIRYVASRYGNFYVRMGRHKVPILTKEDGTSFYDEGYEYVYGKCDVLREGKDLTIAAGGSMVSEALKAVELLKKTNPEFSIELIAVSSIKQFDDTLMHSIQKTKCLLTVEDHNTYSGLGAQLARYVQKEGIALRAFEMMGVENYQLSGKWNELYEAAGLSPRGIAEKAVELIQ